MYFHVFPIKKQKLSFNYESCGQKVYSIFNIHNIMLKMIAITECSYYQMYVKTHLYYKKCNELEDLGSVSFFL